MGVAGVVEAAEVLAAAERSDKAIASRPEVVERARADAELLSRER